MSDWGYDWTPSWGEVDAEGWAKEADVEGVGMDKEGGSMYVEESGDGRVSFIKGLFSSSALQVSLWCCCHFSFWSLHAFPRFPNVAHQLPSLHLRSVLLCYFQTHLQFPLQLVEEAENILIKDVPCCNDWVSLSIQQHLTQHASLCLREISCHTANIEFQKLILAPSN